MRKHGYLPGLPGGRQATRLFGENFTFTARKEEAERLSAAFERHRDDHDRIDRLACELEDLRERMNDRSMEFQVRDLVDLGGIGSEKAIG